MKSFILNALKGFVLGLSIVLPGVSGGTLAFVMGIYEKLIDEISSFKSSHIKSAFLCLSLNRDRMRAFFLTFKETWDWAFILPLLIGMGLAVVLFIRFAGDWIQAHSFIFYSLILGLILASVIPPFQQMQKSIQTFLFFMLSFICSLALFTLDSKAVSLQPSPLLFAPIGFLVAMTLIIPGISGSYLLLVLGLYEKTIFALKNLDGFVISCFILGLALGFILTAKVVKKILTRHWDNSLAVILGLILGGAYSIYPLKEEGFVWSGRHSAFLLWMSLGFLSFLLLHLYLRRKQR